MLTPYPSRFGVLFTSKREDYIENYFPNRESHLPIHYGHSFILGEKVGSIFKNCVVVAFNIDCEVNKVTHGVIAHEVMHAVHEILTTIGMKLSNDSEEAYAYLTGWLIDKVYKVVSENNIKIHLKAE
jgi:hypothetical protein